MENKVISKNDFLSGTLTDGRSYKIVRTVYEDTIGTEGGAAPWMVGSKVTSAKYNLYIGDKNACEMDAKTHKEVQELVNDFNL